MPWQSGIRFSGIEPEVVMAGLVPAIHVLLAAFKKDVDARDERGHDDRESKASNPNAR
jgi:hypothetical protein